MNKKFLFYYLFLQIINHYFVNSFDLTTNSLYQEGKEQYELINSYSQLPKYGDCWKRSIKQVKNGCKHLDDQIQTNLAIMFTYCLLKHLKYDLIECDHVDVNNNDENANLECYEKLKSHQNSFTTFTEFFTHTQNICFFLQNQIWNEKTLELVKESRETQINLLNSVNEAVETQQKLIETNSHLQEVINNSANNVQNVLEEFNQQTKTHKMEIFHLFDRLHQIQSYILGEFTLFYSVIFYLFTLAIAYILTSTKRTINARAGTFIILTSMLLTESVIVSLSKKSLNDYDSKFDLFGYSFDLNYNLYSYIWMSRKIFIYLSFLITVVTAYFYMDYNLSNNKLLIELKNEQNELKSIMNELKMNNMLTSAVITTTPARPLTQTRAILDAETLKRRYLLTDNYDDDDDDRSSNMSTLSICYSNSSADSTFIGSEISDDNTTINDDYDDQSFDISIDEVNYMNNTYKTALGESFSGIMNNVTNILFLDNSHNSLFSIIF
jgi:hypothetical protein